MKKFSIVFLLCLGFSLLSARPISKNAKISLLTVAPGSELYSLFGHSAIRVKDPAQGLDVVYGYGTFDFSDPLFVPKFLKRELDYFIDVDPYKRFEMAYHYFKRSYDERILDLDSTQVQNIYDFLEVNMQPENRFYRYDFFFDNCATRIRDVLFQEIPDQLVLENKDVPGEYTFRQILDLYLVEHPWTDFGMDLLIGDVVDKKATAWEQSFHPDYLADLFDQIQIKKASGIKPLVKETEPLYQIESQASKAIKILSPLYVFTLLLVFVGIMTWKSQEKMPKSFMLDGALFVILGIAGIIVLLLWVATDHLATKNNWNLLWLLPTHIVPGFILLFRYKPSWLSPYFLISGGLSVLLLLTWFFVPQQFHVAYAPLMLLIALRSWVLSRKLTGTTSS